MQWRTKMKMQEAEQLIEMHNRNGYMVHFEWCGDGFLRADYFPDKHAGERLIASEVEAWVYADRFALAMKGEVCNLYVVDHNWKPVNGYKEREIKNR
jgi:hypothetical protein